MEKIREVVVYTDGACSGNPGPGGYGGILKSGAHHKEISGGFRKTTNNRMEILAAIKCLEALKYRCRVKLYSDSRYLVDAMTKNWAARWRANGWMRNRNEPAVNPDLWERMLILCSQHEVEFIWVKGHASTPENNRCDELAVAAAHRGDLPADMGFESRAEAAPEMKLL